MFSERINLPVAGFMNKSVYDSDNDGVVDSAESVPWSGVTNKPSTVNGYGISDTYTKTEVDALIQDIVIDSTLSPTSENPVQNKVIKAALDDKVDKVTGKGLSANDYTTAEKTRFTNTSDLLDDLGLSVVDGKLCITYEG